MCTEIMDESWNNTNPRQFDNVQAKVLEKLYAERLKNWISLFELVLKCTNSQQLITTRAIALLV